MHPLHSLNTFSHRVTTSFSLQEKAGALMQTEGLSLSNSFPQTLKNWINTNMNCMPHIDILLPKLHARC